MDYIELLKNIDYVSFVGAYAKWTFLFLFLSILILVIGTKLKFFKRRTKLARILVKAYYLLIPLYFLIFAFKYAPIRNSQIELNKAIDSKKEVATNFAYDFLSSIVSDSVLTQNSSIKDVVNSYLDTYVYIVDSLSNSGDLKFGKKILYKIKRKIEYAFLTRLVESKIIKKTSGWIGVDEKTGKALYRTDLYSLFKEGEIVDIFKMELNKIFRKIYSSMFLLFGIGLLIPVFEIGLSKIIKY